MTNDELLAIKNGVLAIPMLFASGWSFSGDLTSGAEYKIESASSGQQFLYTLYEKTSGSSTWTLKSTTTGSESPSTLTFSFTVTVNEEEQTKSIVATSAESNCDAVPSMSSDGTVSFNTGYPSGYDNTNGSDKAIERNKFNWLLRAFSQASYFGQTGIRYTYNSDVATAIGGYPRGAVLAHDDGTSIRNVMSLVDNNKHNFLELGVDNIHWKYLDQSDLSGIFPDYGISTYVLTAQVDSSTSSVTQCSEWTEMPRDGWIYPQFDLVDGLTTYLVIGPADGTIPTVDLSGDEYADMIPTDSVNSKNYTKFLLGNNTYSNKYVFPVKKGSKFAVFGRSTDTSPHNVYIKLFRNVS